MPGNFMAQLKNNEPLGLSVVRIPTFAWILVSVTATVNLVAAVVLVLRQPHRASDLVQIYDWCHGWLIGGHSLYVGTDSSTDYPPNAIVMLSPLALLPRPWVVPVWTGVALASTPILAYLVARSVSRADLRIAVFATFLFFTWASVRTLLQFSLLSMTLMFASVRLADSRWVASGIFLGLALAKPHIAGPIALWAMFTERTRVVAVAAVVAIAGWAVYDMRLHEHPLVTMEGYWKVLVATFSGSDGLIGRTSVRAWAYAITGAPRWADMLWLMIAGLLLLVPCRLAVREAHRSVKDSGLAVPSLFCLWSLLTFYHNGNNLIMMAPAFFFLVLVNDPPTLRTRWFCAAILQSVMMFDVPTRLESFAPARGWFRVVIVDFDRLVVIGAFALVGTLWYRLRRASADAEDGLERRVGSARVLASREESLW